MMSKFTISDNDRGHLWWVIHRLTARTEAVIYAEGTPFTADELFAEWVAVCERECELISAQGVYEEVLRNHPEFNEGWLV